MIFIATNKRVQRKTQKKEQNKKLYSKGYTEKEVKQLTTGQRSQELKRIQRNEQQQRRRAENIAKWESLGLDKKSISKLGLRDKNPDKFANAEIKKFKNQQRARRAAETRKANYLRQNRVHHATKNLALSFALKRDGILLDTSWYKGMTFNQIKQRIQARREEAEEDPDDSENLNAFFQIFSGTEEECEDVQRDFEQRGYNLTVGKMIQDEYQSLVNRNDWTMREFAELTLCIIEQCPNSMVEHHIDELKDFCVEANLPFLEIFE